MATACELCGDQIYDGELYRGRVTVGDPKVAHKWCFYVWLGMRLCRRAMDDRVRNGLPTPTSPMFRDPHKPSN